MNPLFTSRIKGNWDNIPEVAERAPPGWKKQHGIEVQVSDAENPELLPEADSAEERAYKKALARTQGRAVTRRATTRRDYSQKRTKLIRLFTFGADLK